MTILYNPHTLTGTETLVFDLDDTLYPHGHFLSDERFFEMLSEFGAKQNGLTLTEAHALTAKFLSEGTKDCMKSWQENHTFDIEAFAKHIDSQDISHMQPNEQVKKFLNDWQGRIVVFTNAHTTHAERLLEHLHLREHVEHICDYTTRGGRMKPEFGIYEELMTHINEVPTNCVMFEDKHKNLEPAKTLGMQTIYFWPEEEEYNYVDRWYPDMPTWINNLKITGKTEKAS